MCVVEQPYIPNDAGQPIMYVCTFIQTFSHMVIEVNWHPAAFSLFFSSPAAWQQQRAAVFDSKRQGHSRLLISGTAHAQVDKVNRQVAARMAGSSSFTSFRKFDERRQGLMRAQLQRILAQDGLSENVYEIVSSSLQD